MVSKILVGALALSAATNGVLLGRLSNQAAKSVVIETELRACGARLSNVIEDLESDNAIDNVGDLRDFVIPDSWMLPETN